MEEMNTIEMQAQESAAGTAGYAESTAPAGPEAPQGDLGGADNEGTGARRQTPEENARFAAMTAENNQLAHALCIEGGNYVFQNGLLGGIAGMDAERKFALPRIVCTERYGRHHHAAYTGIL